MTGGGRHRLGESALESGNGLAEEDTDWERAHLIGSEWCGGGRRRLGESALDRARGGEERDDDWERAHLRVFRNVRQRCRLGESALRVGRDRKSVV